jgi:hypothetical protein
MEDPRAERAVALGVMVVAAIVGTALVSVGPSRNAPRAAVAAIEETTTSSASHASTTATTAPPPAAPATTATTAATTDAGSLPQTTDEPVASGAMFDAGVQGLWNAIVTDDPASAMPFFFPKSAYLQVKAISDPASDYDHRLIANYEQDIHSLHAQLGTNAGGAHLDGIDVPAAQAVLVQPGEESNKLQYWRVYGTTLRYTLDGTSGTMPVTSLISWRGEWYVVHLGAIR